MAMNNIGLAGSENGTQPGVNTVIETRMFAQIMNLYASLFQ
jgi:hypothetical protein